MKSYEAHKRLESFLVSYVLDKGDSMQKNENENENEEKENEEDEEDESAYWLIPLAVIVIPSFIHSIRTRTFEDFFHYSLYLAIPLEIGLFIFLLYIWHQEGFKRPTREEMIKVIIFSFMMLISGVFYYGVGAALKDLFLWMLAPPLSEGGAIVATMTITLFMGLTLFYIKSRFRSFYGLSEALVGLTVAGYHVAIENSNTSVTTGFYLAILTAGVYLVVRGLDNIHQGLTKEPLDPIAISFLTRFKNKNPTGMHKNDK